MSARARWQSESCAPLALSTVDGDPVQDQVMGDQHTQAARRDKEREKGRISPDPMQQTDRYRLVMPFTSHL